MLDTRTIIINIKEGAEHSFKILYETWVSRLYHFVYHYVKSESITDDIIQETFCQIWINRAKLSPDKSIQAFIFTISYHLILKELRHQLNNPLMGEYISYQDSLTTSDNETGEALEFDQFQHNTINKDVVKALISRFCLFEGTWRKYHGLQDAELYLNECLRVSKELTDSHPTLHGNYDEVFNSKDLNNMQGILLYRQYELNLVAHSVTRVLMSSKSR